MRVVFEDQTELNWKPGSIPSKPYEIILASEKKGRGMEDAL